MLQKIYYSFLFLFFTITSLPAQLQCFHIPYEANTLKLQNKNDLMIAAGIMRGQTNHEYYSPDGLEYDYFAISQSAHQFQMAYSPIKHLGLFGFHSFLNFTNKKSEDLSGLYHQSRNTGGGIGTYYSFKFSQRPSNKIKAGQKVKHDVILLDLYAGYAFGELKNQYHYSVVGNNNFNFQKLYGQVGLHWQSTRIGISYVFKKGIVNYYKGIIIGKTTFHDSVIQTILTNDKIPFQESTLKFDYQKKGISYYLQMTFASAKGFSYLGTQYRLSHIGMVFDIQKIRTHLFKKK